MKNKIEDILKGTLKEHIVHEFLTRTSHFPIVNIILESLLYGPFKYFTNPDIYALLFGSIVQAYFLGKWRYEKNNRFLLGNLIGPAIYTCIEVVMEGMIFFSFPYHIAYWIFSFIAGLLDESQNRSSGKFKDLLIILENVTRTCILLAMYWIFESSGKPKYISVSGFLSDKSHIFIAIVIPLLGLILGYANVNANHFQIILQNTAAQLKKYSKWFLGDEILSEAITDSNVLNLKRKERAIIFMDIRNFTSWSESKTPEEVVTMLNNYFETAEKILKNSEVIKVKPTADEIMLVFPSSIGAINTAIKLSKACNNFLKSFGLSAGIGINCGHIVEGLIGSTNVKIYDIIGDAVNTAKRICDKAAGGEILISDAVFNEVRNEITVLDSKLLTVKGKKDSLKVFPIANIN